MGKGTTKAPNIPHPAPKLSKQSPARHTQYYINAPLPPYGFTLRTFKQSQISAKLQGRRSEL